ncbi:MAG TPA: alpha/beta hydrolase-fold protein [Kineosporiaceae bacterium]|nr:alpha/beta hydrolase-fold protein [Kineosporiaceae bacterium]
MAATSILLAIGSIVLTVWLWPRLARGGWPRWAARVGLVILCQVTAVVLAAVGLNDYFDFYNSWSDLLGVSRTNGPLAIQMVSYGPGGEHDPKQMLSVHVDRTFTSPVRRPGHTDSIVVKGARSHISGQALVYLPPQYDDPAYAHTKFPMTVVVAGYPGHIGTLVRNLEVPRTMNTMISQGQVRPMIMVMVSPTVAPPRDTECADVPDGPQTETWLAEDVPQAIAAKYRVTEPRTWGILGVSTGGFCAVKLAMRHPDTFCCTVGMSGYLHAVTDVTTGDLYAGNIALREASDPLWRLSHLPVPPIRVLLTTSMAEKSLYAQAQEFVAHARPPLQVGTIIVPSGGHNFGVWVDQLPTCLQWLSLAIPGGPTTGVQLPAPTA